MREFSTTAEIPVPGSLIEQVIGQDAAAKIVRKAAAQKRNVLLLGPPGTGKSMLAQAMAEIMPGESLEDVLVYHNQNEENKPLIRVVKTNPSLEEMKKDPLLSEMYSDAVKGKFAGMAAMPGKLGSLQAVQDNAGVQGKAAAAKQEAGSPHGKKERDSYGFFKQTSERGHGRRIVEFSRRRMQIQGRGISPAIIFIGLALLALVFIYATDGFSEQNKWFTLAVLLGIGALVFIWRFTNQLGRRMGFSDGYSEPKLIVDNSGMKTAPFVDATGSKAGALFGDVKHDPLQCIPSDGLVHLSNGKPVRIADLIDPLLSNQGERELMPSEMIELLGGCDERYCYTPNKAIRVYKKSYQGKLVEIKTVRGYTITVTPNHPIAVLNNEGNVEYIEAGNLSPNSFLVSPYRLPIAKKSDVSMAFIKFLAYFLADGYASQRMVGFKIKRQFKIDEIEKCLKENEFGYHKRVYRQATIFNINSASLVRRLEGIGARRDGKKSIPSIIFDSDKEGLYCFVSSYLSLDGYVNKQGQFELFSKEMIDDFAPLLLKIGIRANLEERQDPGYGKGKLQHFLLFSNYEFAVEYSKRTVNPHHISNLNVYLAATEGTHITFADIVPVSFTFLEQIRERTGLSQTRVHRAYYALKSGLKTSQCLTRQMLGAICCRMLSHTNCPDLYRLKNISDGTYSFDQIKLIGKKDYSGYVYNFTTETGNYLVNNILTHNSGGLGTPAHLRVEAGAIHRANKGVLFIDEIASLSMKSQQDILTAMQEKQFPITGQSEQSSGAIVKTEAVPCDFVLVAAGNIHDIQGMHPALRSRIRGNGYEVYVEESVPDSEETENLFARFVAQEIKKDGKIPHFSREAVLEILSEARKRSARKKHLSLNLRELGGLIRAAGDIAKEEGALRVDAAHIIKARGIAQTLEQQISTRSIEYKKDYRIFVSKGSKVGRVNGLAVMGDGTSGIVLPIVAEVTPAASKNEGKIIATGKLGKIAKEAVSNVSAIIKKHMGRNISNYDIHVQFLQTYEGVEGDSASVSVALAVISALEGIGVSQDFAMTGSLSVRGEVLPIGGVNAKCEAAFESGIENVIVPKTNAEGIFLSEKAKKSLKVYPVSSIGEVLKLALHEGKKKETLLKRLHKNIAEQ